MNLIFSKILINLYIYSYSVCLRIVKATAVGQYEQLIIHFHCCFLVNAWSIIYQVGTQFIPSPNASRLSCSVTTDPD